MTVHRREHDDRQRVDDADRRRQAVNAVEQVDRVNRGQEPDQGDWDADQTQFDRPAEELHLVDHQAAKDKDAAGKELAEQFLPSAESDGVVEHAQQHDDRAG